MNPPMLADFAIRLAGGMAALLLIAPWRQIPMGFFRTHCVVILALLVLGGMVAGWSGTDRVVLGAIAGAAVLAYVGSITWGLGLPKVAVPVTAGLTLVAAGLLVAFSRGGASWLEGLNVAGRFASAMLLGSTLSAMLLGHYYLTAPAMSITPLRRFVACMGAGLVVRSALAAVGLMVWWRSGTSADPGALTPLFLGMRWGMGVAGPGLAAVLAWKTVQIRSTQSATGILYIGMTLVLFGELSAMVLSQSAGVVL